MKNPFEIRKNDRTVQTIFLFFLAGMCFLACASPAAAQKDKKKKNATPDSKSSDTFSALSDEQQIDYTISEMLGAWQLGDIERMHKDYADEVSIVNGSWAPPVIGWTNYLAIYQLQRSRMSQVRMDRSNTYIKVSGTVAWVCYQWDFGAVVEGQQTQSEGHTTLVLEKRNNRWVIVHNHTSLVITAPQAAPANPPAQQQPTSTPSTSQPPPTKPSAR
jgi:ketosteroid isomerase-like protein